MTDNNRNEQQQIVRGMLHIAVLAELTCGKKCGVDLLIALDKTPFSSKVGTLYPLLSRMEKNGLLAAEWNIIPGKTPRKYYYLTKLGKEKLQAYRQFLTQIYQYLGGKKVMKTIKVVLQDHDFIMSQAAADVLAAHLRTTKKAALLRPRLYRENAEALRDVLLELGNKPISKVAMTKSVNLVGVPDSLRLRDVMQTRYPRLHRIASRIWQTLRRG